MQFANNAFSTVGTAINNVVTTLVLASGEGARFPTPSGGDYFLLTLTQATAETSWEIVKVTARSTDTLTIVRGQEGTTAASWGVGSKAQLRLTSGTMALLVDTTAIQTLTNKTISAGTFSNGVTESVYTITDAAGFAITPSNGSIQKVTLGASRTPVSTGFSDGQSVTLMVADGTNYTITWTSMPVTWVGGTAPTLATTGWTVIELFKVSGTIYGKAVGNVA